MSTAAAPPRSSAREAALAVEPVVSTSSTRSTRLPCSRALASTGHAEGALQVLLPLRLGQPDLPAGALDAGEQEGIAGHAALPRDDRRASAIAWLNRRRHSRQRCSGTGTITSASASSSAPARAIMPPERPGELQPVAVFQPVHQQARGAVIFRHRPGALEDRRIGDGGRREQGLAEIDRRRAFRAARNRAAR